MARLWVAAAVLCGGLGACAQLDPMPVEFGDCMPDSGVPCLRPIAGSTPIALEAMGDASCSSGDAALCDGGARDDGDASK